MALLWQCHTAMLAMALSWGTIMKPHDSATAMPWVSWVSLWHPYAVRYSRKTQCRALGIIVRVTNAIARQR